PALDHQREQVAVLISPAGVGLPLIPDDTPDAVADRRLEYPVIDVAGPGVPTHQALGILGLPRRLLTFGLGARDLVPPGGALGRVLRLGLGVVLLDLLPVAQQGSVLRIGRQQVAADPGLARRAAPGVVDQADRDLQDLVQLAPEEITDRGE